MNPISDLGNIRRTFLIKLIIMFLCSVLCLNGYAAAKPESASPVQLQRLKRGQMINLPDPKLKGVLSLEEALAKRESVRQFKPVSLTLKQLSQLLWAAQGVTRKWGGRTAPSAGALYPLEIYVATRDGLFHYNPSKHQLMKVSEQNLVPVIAKAALEQNSIAEAPSVFIITAVYERTSLKYRDRAERYVKIEVGHVAQNILLQAAAMGLAAVPVGAFFDQMIHQSLKLPPEHQPLYIIPVGHQRK